MKSAGATLAAPVLCLALLGGMVVQQRSRLRPDDAVVRDYHERAKAVVNAMPPMPQIEGVTWNAEKRDPETAAVRLLKPNIILSRHYVEGVTDRYPRTADLLIVQCRDSRDMTGHYPPICYKNIGYEMVEAAPREPVRVGADAVTFTEYHFERWSGGQPQRVCIYNFFVVPGRGVVADIGGVHEAAEDYERRFFGAAQFQVLIPLNQVPRRQDRDAIFAGLLRSHPELIGALKDDGLTKPG